MALKDKLDEEPKKVDPLHESELLRKVNRYYRNRNYIKFYENYRKLSEDNKNSKKQLLQKLYVDKNVKNYGGALNSLDRLISLSPDDIKLYEDKISILEKFNDYQGIKEVYNEMLKIWPDNPEIKSRRNKLLRSRNKPRKSFNGF